MLYAFQEEQDWENPDDVFDSYEDSHLHGPSNAHKPPTTATLTLLKYVLIPTC